MANDNKKTTAASKPVVYHKSLLTDEIRNSGKEYTYTEDWAQVTDPEHLKIRQKAVLDAQRKTEKTEAEAAGENK